WLARWRRCGKVESRRPGKLELLTAIASTLLMVWAMLPEHQRQLLAMKTAAASRNLAGNLARRQGHAGMGDELAGRGQGRQHYGAAYHLSRARDELGRVLDRMRP